MLVLMARDLTNISENVVIPALNDFFFEDQKSHPISAPKNEIKDGIGYAEGCL